MVFSKNAFFFLLFLLLLSPIVVPNIVWLLRSVKTTGTVQGIGQATGISLGSDTYAYVRFVTARGETTYFQGKDDHYTDGDVVPVRYQPANPENARIAAFWSVWGNTIAFGGVPFMFWCICFFAPDMVPKNSKVVVGRKPFLKLQQ